MFRIMSLNCNGLREPLKINYLKSELDIHKFDIVFLQETHINNLQLVKGIANLLNYDCYWSFTDNNRGKGTAILINGKFDCEITYFESDHFGRYVYVDLKCNGFYFRCVSIYAPNNEKDRKTFFNDIYKIFLCKKTIILAGDFNCVGNLNLDKKGGNRNRGNGGWEQLHNIIKDFNLIDCFRKIYPTKHEFTWSSQGVSCRLDRIYISNVLIDSIHDIFHTLYPFSDHKMVSVNFSQFNHQQTGPSYWKFNTSLLNDPNYIDYMTIFLKNNIANYPKNEEILLWWDNLKELIKSATVVFSKNKAKRQRFEINCLRKDYIQYEQAGNYEEAQRIKDELKSIEMDKLRGSQIRSKAQQLEGEKPSKYFLYKELINNKKKNIEKIIDINGEEQTQSEDILNCFKLYFEDLFKLDNVDEEVIHDLLTDMPKISEDEQKVLGDKIKSDEILHSLYSFKNGKSPGNDGLSKEFYVAFIDLLLPVLTEVFNITFNVGHLSDSQKLSYITLICKDKDNPELMNNYRPISLLNIDYKILTKTLSKRLESVLDKVIHPDQTCGVPGRSIIDNGHLIRDLIDYSNLKNINGVLLSIDQQKAFDRISHKYMLEVLKAFGMGRKFIKWIELIYNDVTSSVIVNHFVSESFKVLKSVRQGCCLSPLLYILCLEPILNRIRNDNQVKGFHIPGKGEQKLTAFADDSNFSLLDDNSVQKVIYHFEYFGKASGSKLNKQKSQGMFLGKWKSRSDHPFGISWVKKMKIFGITFGNVSNFEIWDPLYKKIVNVLNMYKLRNLSLFGRACIVNVMALSKLWYLATVLYVPETFIDLVEKEIFRFIWNNKMELLSRDVCSFPKLKGGLSLTNVRIKILSLQLSQVSKIVFCKDLPWTFFGDIWLGIQLKRFSEYNFTNLIPHCIQDLPIYYDAVCKSLNFVKELDQNVIPSKGARCIFFYMKLIDAFVKQQGKLNVENKFVDIDFKQAFENEIIRKLTRYVLM